MKLFNYKKTSAWELKKYFEKKMEYYDYQVNIPSEVFEHSPYTFIVFEKPPKTELAYRLTILFFLAYWLLLLIASLVKWVCTGDRYFNPESKPIVLLKKWSQKLGFRI